MKEQMGGRGTNGWENWWKGEWVHGCIGRKWMDEYMLFGQVS